MMWVSFALLLVSVLGQSFLHGKLPLEAYSLLQWFQRIGLVILMLSIFLILIAFFSENPVASSYVRETLPYHVRGIGLFSILVILIYFAFFFDKSALSDHLRESLADNEAKLITLELRLNRLVNAAKVENIDEPLLKGNEDRKTIGGPSQKMLIMVVPQEIESIEALIENTRRSIALLKKRLDDLSESGHHANVLFAIRALCLGGIGALVTLLARRTIGAFGPVNEQTFFSIPKYWPLLITHTILGGLIALVAFALFYTKQITIFKPEFPNGGASGDPEFWRVTLLCIIAGAFAEKIYGAVSSRVEKYVDEPNPNAR